MTFFIILILQTLRSPFYFLLNVPAKKHHLYSRVHLEYILGGPQKLDSDLPLAATGNRCLIAKSVEREKNLITRCFLSVKGKEEMQLDFYTYKYISKAQSFYSDFSFFASFPAPFINMVMIFFKK